MQLEGVGLKHKYGRSNEPAALIVFAGIVYVLCIHKPVCGATIRHVFSSIILKSLKIVSHYSTCCEFLTVIDLQLMQIVATMIPLRFPICSAIVHVFAHLRERACV